LHTQLRLKKRSSYIILATLLIVSGLAVYIYKHKGKSSSFNTDARNFKFKDTARITKIFIADKEGDRSTLERTKKGWVVNNKFNCRGDAILNLMEAIKNVEVKMPVNKNARDGVIRAMATMATKVEIYAGEECVRKYYVGHETADSEGSYMLLSDPDSDKNQEEPFVCFIPGFTGYLIPRFISKEDEWRDRLVINYIPPQIRSIKVQHHEKPDSSFTIDVLNMKTFNLKNGKGESLAFDEFKMKQYLAYYQNLSYEALLNSKQKRLTDSLSATKPFTTITVNETNFRVSTFYFYHKFPSVIDAEYGVVYKYDPDRIYMRFGEKNDWALAQTFVFGKLLINYNYFFAPTANPTVKK
jgi:hypothetical protein